jgi:ribosome-associated toxin RatA of RatAB toxin-antitoxin module
MNCTLLLAAMMLASAALAQSTLDRTGWTSDSAGTHGSQYGVEAAASPSSSDVRVEQSGDRIIVRARAEVDADAGTIWSTLSDYDRLAQFLPDMSSSRTISRDGSEAIVEQKGSAGLGLIRQRFTTLLAVKEIPQHSISMSSVGGDFKLFDARYDIVPLASHRSRIVYDATIIPDVSLPLFITLPIMRATISTQFAALVQEVLRRAGHA